ncbi:MAG TPA: response regulator [bacterium]|nr:response regulator [bacterium]
MRVLTVDDSAVARRVIRHELEEAGYEVLEAASGEDALNVIAAERPDLITLDVHMAGMDGYETCRRIRALELLEDQSGDRGVPIVFITADDTLAGRVEGFHAGAADFLVKPCVPGSVQRVVDGLLRPPPARHGLRALVVDDSPLVRRIVTEGLVQLGLEVLPVGDGEEALDLLQRDPDAVHLVVTDYIMAHMSGDELCRHIRKDPGLAWLPVMVMSALDQTDYLLAIFRAGATDFVPKPFVKEVFQSRVVALLQGHAPGRSLRQRLVALYGETHYRQALKRFGQPEGGGAMAVALQRADALRACQPQRKGDASAAC